MISLFHLRLGIQSQIYYWGSYWTPFEGWVSSSRSNCSSRGGDGIGSGGGGCSSRDVGGSGNSRCSSGTSGGGGGGSKE